MHNLLAIASSLVQWWEWELSHWVTRSWPWNGPSAFAGGKPIPHCNHMGASVTRSALYFLVVLPFIGSTVAPKHMVAQALELFPIYWLDFVCQTWVYKNLSHAAKSYWIKKYTLINLFGSLVFVKCWWSKINFCLKSTFTTQHVSVNCNSCDNVNCLMLY
jgi:hypothetical protein